MTRRLSIAAAGRGARTRWAPVLAGALACLALSSAPARADAPPAWLQSAKVEAAAFAAASAKSAAVVLVDEEEVTVLENGRLRTVRRYAMQLQQRDGREAAVIRQVYYPDAGKAPRLRGWLLRASGETRELGGDAVVDASLSDSDVYNEVRVRALGAGEAIAPGDIFGAEVEQEERALFSQIDWTMQGRWPARRVLRRLTLPSGWDAKSVTFNHAAIEPARQPQAQGAAWTWQLADLPALADEPGMPPYSALVPRVAVSYAKPGAAKVAAGQFGSWSDVATWLAGLSDAPAAASDPVARRARELTAGAATERERIAALARFAQGVPYASIQTGVGRGGGYTPRAAALVLERSYGDCKDKATLLRALLAAVGVRSWLVSIYSGDPDYVRDAFPSPQQFNHAIIAIALTETIGASSELVHPSLGRLLFFDPTDESTPLGELPLAEQGSLALVVSAGREDALVRMPLAPPESHRTRRTFAAALDATGGLTLDIRESSHGARAADARAVARAAGTARLREWAERRVAAAFPGGRLLEFTQEEGKAGANAGVTASSVTTSGVTTSGVTTSGITTSGGTASGTAASSAASSDAAANVTAAAADAGASTLRIRVRADSYAQTMPGQLLLFQPPFAFGGETPALTGATRTHPLVLDPLAVEEALELTLPDGFAFDEVPPAVSVETAFGRYALTSTRPDAARLVLTRRLDVPRRTVPAAEHAAAKVFFEKVRTADAAPIVLVKKAR